MEALEEHCAPAAVAVQEANYPSAVPSDETDDRRRGLGPRYLQLQRCPCPIGATHRHDNPRFPRSDRTFRSKLPLLKEVACDRRQHTRPFAGHVIACHESTENARRNNELSISAHAQQFTTERHAADPNGHHGP
ncbi:hypothetical protein GCM10025863_02170 [Microbacterium suwonense]|uniref:Uncharacterized protein n=1 Tax=Microbacterium suwonense TaxID=683047 RepID=A0ABM8FQ75_9MICO|nr:hypothetical protein GCM10025863_02170 [Microbacterium suwonense]